MFISEALLSNTENSPDRLDSTYPLLISNWIFCPSIGFLVDDAQLFSLISRIVDLRMRMRMSQFGEYCAPSCLLRSIAHHEH